MKRLRLVAIALTVLAGLALIVLPRSQRPLDASAFNKKMQMLERHSQGLQPSEWQDRVRGWIGQTNYHQRQAAKKLDHLVRQTTPEQFAPEQLLRFINTANMQAQFDCDLAHAVANWTYAGFDTKPVQVSPQAFEIAEALLDFYYEQALDCPTDRIQSERQCLHLTRTILAHNRSPYEKTNDLSAFANHAIMVGLNDENPALVREAVAAREETHRLYREEDFQTSINLPSFTRSSKRRIASTMLQAFEHDPEQWQEFREPIERMLQATEQEFKMQGTDWDREWSQRLRTRFQNACAAADGQ